MIGTLDVKRVDRDAAFGADAGERDVEGVVADDLGEPIEETDLIARLDFHDGALHRELMVNIHGGRKRAVQGFSGRRGEVARRSDFFSLRGDVGEQVAVGHERFLDGAGEFLLGGGTLHDASAGFDDVEGVDSDMVGAGNDL